MKKIFFLVNRFYQNLKLLFDPALEGNPYIKDIKDEEDWFSINLIKTKSLSINFKQT